MSRRSAALLEFDAIAIEGGLLPAEWLGKVALLDAGQQKPEVYGVLKGLNLRDELGRYWRVAMAHWGEFDSARQASSSTDVAINRAATVRFVGALLREVFGFTDLAPHSEPLIFDERNYPITASALNGRLPVVVAAHDQRLDERDPRFGGDGRQRSAFGLLQDYLNAADPALWGLASNGLALRLARDNASFTRPAWIEADLERIFTEDRFADFSLLWLLIHASRFGKPGDLPQLCVLETWREASREEGTRAREQLRGAVEDALQSLGQGFVSSPVNQTLRDRFADGSLTPTVYFQQLLRLVYRLIFLLTIEERGVLHVEGSQSNAVDLYHTGYSLQRLRELSRRRRAFDRHHDLWQSLKPVFVGLAHGQPFLALPALGGLFADDQCPDLDTADLGNAALLAAVFKLSWIRSDGALLRINWRDMGPEEFGSVYESLLELVPEIAEGGRQFRFAGAEQSRGNARKTSGSYYTPDALVQELLDSALEPVIAQRIAGAADQQDALLKITICDPACGSGHFLLAAARRLANHLARLRAGGTPSGEDYRHALRDVINHCIYGVDLNPLALELARMSLWLEAMTPDKPLGFIDHHLQCGDALLGVLDPTVLDHGLPDDAFSALSGDDKSVALALKKRNKAERQSWQRALSVGDLFRSEHLADRTDAVERIANDDLDAIAAKQTAWQRAEAAAHDSRMARLADLFVGTFLLPKTKASELLVPTSLRMWAIAKGETQDDQARAIEDAARDVCAQNRVLHWWVAFPQIAQAGGFAVMLGNPPWERIKLQEEEFFAARSPQIANAINKAERGHRIELLREGRLLQTLEADESRDLPQSSGEQALHQSFLDARRSAEAASAFVHSGSAEQPARYPLTGVGDVNTYALFAETFVQLMAVNGRAGIIVPTGIATDDSTKAFFEHLAVNGLLRSLLCLENEEFVFRAVHHAFRFALMTTSGESTEQPAQLAFFARQPHEIHDLHRRFALTAGDFALINPNTRTCPVFRSQRDAELTKALYGRAQVLIREAVIRNGSDGGPEIVTPEINSWGIRFSTMFHMSSDSGLFPTGTSESVVTLPLYEAKMIHQFDHRWATYVDAPDKPDGVEPLDVSDAQKADSTFVVRPRYRVDEREVLARVARVPSAVAKSWLAKHAASEISEHQDTNEQLRLALAQWTAGELFRREAGAPDNSDGFSDTQRLRAGPRAERDLAARFPTFAEAIKSTGLSSRKFITDCTKWAQQDRDTPLDDAELVTLAALTDVTAGRDDEDVLRDELDRWMDRRSPRWLMGWRDITGVEKIRTVIATVLPRVGVGHTMPLWYSNATPLKQAALLGCLNSLALDYVARQKVGGTHLTYGYLKQFPVLPPDHYADTDLAFIVPRVLELTYVATDLAFWAADLGYTGAPFPWNSDRRAELRAELDAYYARLYGLTREDLRYVLDPADVMGSDYPSESFRVLKKSEISTYGEYRTQRLVLHAFDRMTLADEAGNPYETLLVPAPGVQPEATYSDQGTIRNSDEAQYAGFVFALIREAKGPLPRQQLNQALNWLKSPLLLKQRLPELSAARLDELLGLLPEMAAVDLDTRVGDVLRALETAGCIRVESQGSAFRGNDGVHTPAWVVMVPNAVELARLFDTALQVDDPAQAMLVADPINEQRKA